jgi:hypothetical protein
MSSYLRKSIAMGVYAQNNQQQNFGYFAPDWQATNTAWVRFWVDWTQLAPYAQNNPQTDNTTVLPQGGTPQQYVQALDSQISYARSLGLKVVLTFFKFPTWTNGTTTSTPLYYLYPPNDLSGTSPWASYLYFCLSHWSSLNPNNGGAYADWLEICNEPNIFLADKPFGGYQPPSHVYAGRMMVTAQYIQRATGITTPLLAGPAVLDAPGVTDRHIDCRDYVANLLGYLSTNGFSADTLFAWSHHNYTDISNGTTTLAQAIRGSLKAYGWTGWPYGDSSNPYMLQTECGARFDQLGASEQARRVDVGYTNCHNDTAGLGQGLAMFTQYLDVTDPGFDTGLQNTAYAHRQLYAQWAAEPQP